MIKLKRINPFSLNIGDIITDSNIEPTIKGAYLEIIYVDGCVLTCKPLNEMATKRYRSDKEGNINFEMNDGLNFYLINLEI